MSRRAVDVLAAVETIAAEDTRRTAALLAHLKVRRPRLVSLRDDNEARASEKVLGILERGEDVALVSDAGTPLISDPGFRLVQLCWTRGVPLTPVPGASAVTAALSVCPLAVDGCGFVGFLRSAAAARQRQLQSICAAPRATLFFEAPHRIESTLAIIDGLAPARRLMAARELTKKFEALLLGTAAEVLAELASTGAVRGEFVCVLEGMAAPNKRQPDEERLLRSLLRELPPARAARVMAEACGGTKAEYYDRIMRAAEQAGAADV